MLFGPAPGGGEDVVLTERAHTLRTQPGDISFPGGKREPETRPTRRWPCARRRRRSASTPRRSTSWPSCARSTCSPRQYVVRPVLAWWREPGPVDRVDPARGPPRRPRAAGRPARPGGAVHRDAPERLRRAGVRVRRAVHLGVHRRPAVGRPRFRRADRAVGSWGASARSPTATGRADRGTRSPRPRRKAEPDVPRTHRPGLPPDLPAPQLRLHRLPAGARRQRAVPRRLPRRWGARHVAAAARRRRLGGPRLLAAAAHGRPHRRRLHPRLARAGHRRRPRRHPAPPAHRPAGPRVRRRPGAVVVALSAAVLVWFIAGALRGGAPAPDRQGHRRVARAARHRRRRPAADLPAVRRVPRGARPRGLPPGVRGARRRADLARSRPPTPPSSPDAGRARRRLLGHQGHRRRRGLQPRPGGQRLGRGPRARRDQRPRRRRHGAGHAAHPRHGPVLHGTGRRLRPRPRPRRPRRARTAGRPAAPGPRPAARRRRRRRRASPSTVPTASTPPASARSSTPAGRTSTAARARAARSTRSTPRCARATPVVRCCRRPARWSGSSSPSRSTTR